MIKAISLIIHKKFSVPFIYNSVNKKRENIKKKKLKSNFGVLRDSAIFIFL